MNALDLFAGRRPFPVVRLEWNRGKTALTCAAWAEWRLIPPSPVVLSCGAERTETMTRRYGVSRTEREELESTLGSSLGVKGIASIESAIRSGMSTEISFDVGEEVQSTFRFTAPVNGRRTVLLYQLTHGFHMSFSDSRFWHRDEWERAFVEWLAPVFDASKVEPIHPSCSGGGDPETHSTANPIRVASGTIGKLGVQWTDDNNIQFADQSTVINTHFNFGPDETTAVFTGANLPDYLRFLGRVEEQDIVEMKAWQEDTGILGEPLLSRTPDRVIGMDDEDYAIAGEDEDGTWAVT